MTNLDVEPITIIGIAPGDYGCMQLRHPELMNASTNTGNLLSIAANRISYFFDFQGPSMALETACSSSLVAVHLACQSLWLDECTCGRGGSTTTADSIRARRCRDHSPDMPTAAVGT